MRVGYARVSDDQTLDMQRDALTGVTSLKGNFSTLRASLR